MLDSFEEALNKYSDEELDRMVEEGDFSELFSEFMKPPSEEDVINNVRQQLEELNRRVLSDEVEDYFLDEKAKFVVMNDGLMIPRMAKDDRLADNLDNVLAHFDISGRVELPYAQNEKLERLQMELGRLENKGIGEFMMRTPSEYLKLLIYYAKVGSFEDMRTIFDKYDDKREEISNEIRYFKSEGGPLSVIDHHLVEFMVALPGRTLELILERTNINSSRAYNKLFLENSYMIPFIGSVPFKLLDYLMGVSKVNSVDSMLALTSNEDFRKSLSSVDSRGAYSDNLVSAMKYFKIEDMEGAQELIEFQRIRDVMKKASSANFSTLMRVSDLDTVVNLERLCNNVTVSQNIGDADYEVFDNFLTDLGVEPKRRNVYMYEVITHSYNKRTGEQAKSLSSALGQKSLIPTNLNEFIVELMHDEDYLEQNLDSVIQLVQGDVISDEEKVDSLKRLKDIMGGFLTPELSKKYLLVDGVDEKDKVLENYRVMMAQVLGSSKIEIEDRDMLSEIIYLAYRPTGYSINQIREMIGFGWSSLQDLTEHLDNIKFDREGYDMNFNFVAREQTVEYDVDSLRGIDSSVATNSSEVQMSDLLFQALSGKPKHQNALPSLFSRVLTKMNDDRVISYNENYYSDKGISREYTEQRLESLKEILGIIPKEESFYSALSQVILESDELRAIAQSNADMYQWKKNKRNFSSEERTCKNKLDEIIKHLERDISADVSEFLQSPEITALDDGILNLDNNRLYDTLVNIRADRFLGYDDEMETSVDVFYQALLQYANSCNGFVKREMKKVESVKSDEIAEVKGVVSKNIGSYFAKAGAEICTSHNVAMWNEERHAHLNLVYKDQIIGNVMLYFEPERDYMVVRGFNPRKDTMMRFDRYSMASQIVGVLEQIAQSNGYSEVFIPEQTSWHALSNRDGMAKEISGISRRNVNRTQELYPNQRTEINDAQFYVTEIGGHSIDKLNLLTLVKN